MGERTYIVTTFIKKLKKGEKEWVLSPQGFKRVSDDKPVDISKLPEDDKGLYYKDEPYTTKKLQQRYAGMTMAELLKAVWNFDICLCPECEHPAMKQMGRCYAISS